MARRVALSGAHLGLLEISGFHDDAELGLRLRFDPSSFGYDSRFLGYTERDVQAELVSRRQELQYLSSLAVMASVEAAFRIDYLQRCYRRDKDKISRAFRELYQNHGVRVSLEDEILAVWLEYSSAGRSTISELRGAFKYRHWLAHGRYWVPKLGRIYDYPTVFVMATNALASFPLRSAA